MSKIKVPLGVMVTCCKGVGGKRQTPRKKWYEDLSFTSRNSDPLIEEYWRPGLGARYPQNTVRQNNVVRFPPSETHANITSNLTNNELRFWTGALATAGGRSEERRVGK